LNDKLSFWTLTDGLKLMLINTTVGLTTVEVVRSEILKKNENRF
jgi:hypothetical protein